LHFQKSYGFVLVGVVVKSCEWVRVGSRRAAPKVNHASCYNVYAGITRYGVTSMCTVAGTTKHTSIYTNKKGQQSKNITSHEYYDVLTKHLLPERRGGDSSHLLGSAGGCFSKIMTLHTKPPQQEHCKIGRRRLLAMWWSFFPTGHPTALT
jgi:hypothetical protein